MQVVLTKLHAGGKFGGDMYKVSGGLHGVGVSVVNALSERLHVLVRWSDGKVYEQDYARGEPLGPLTATGTHDGRTGTTVTFLPDLEIFDEGTYDYSTLAQRMREMAFLTAGLSLTLIDSRGEDRRETWYYEGGIAEYVRHINAQKEPIHERIVAVAGREDDVDVEVALQWNASYQPAVFSFANNINTHEGGTHLTGFKSALTRTVNNYARSSGALKEKDEGLSGEDVLEGLAAIISVKLREPQFEGQTKTKLGNSPVAGIVNTLTGQQLAQFFDENPNEARAVVQKVVPAARARAAARRAREAARKTAFGNGGLPGQARRLLVDRPVPLRAVPRRGQERRRHGVRRPQPGVPGHPAAARQDPERREGAHRQGLRQHARSRPWSRPWAPARARSSTSRRRATTSSW